nr:hypothetical protein B0A51_18059 [Rachicladosporium sp. CCFEE 5018]
MVYESKIEFTLDTICPWTYLAMKRLNRALASLSAESPVQFTLVYKPFQLYPAASKEGEDKYAWYKTSKYGDSAQKMEMYTTLMTAYGVTEGIKFKFGGTMANTLQAHRCVHLYRQYFEEERHPSSTVTLLAAFKDAGIDDAEAKQVVEDEYEGLSEAKELLQEQKGNGIDSVPYIVFEGRRRDVTLEGCREVNEYVKAIETIIKECS